MYISSYNWILFCFDYYPCPYPHSMFIPFYLYFTHTTPFVLRIIIFYLYPLNLYHKLNIILFIILQLELLSNWHEHKYPIPLYHIQLIMLKYSYIYFSYKLTRLNDYTHILHIFLNVIPLIIKLTIFDFYT